MTKPVFPPSHVHMKAYEDYKTGETDANYETCLDLTKVWMLLTTSYNGSKANGYFGAAYWHPEYQQVVIAHRSTKCKNLEAYFTT